MKSNKKSEWDTKCEDLFVCLLHEMSKFLGYSFSKVVIQKGCYFPIAHGERENIQNTINSGLYKIFNGDSAFPIEVKQDFVRREVAVEYEKEKVS